MNLVHILFCTILYINCWNIMIWICSREWSVWKCRTFPHATFLCRNVYDFIVPDRCKYYFRQGMYIFFVFTLTSITFIYPPNQRQLQKFTNIYHFHPLSYIFPLTTELYVNDLIHNYYLL